MKSLDLDPMAIHLDLCDELDWANYLVVVEGAQEVQLDFPTASPRQRLEHPQPSQDGEIYHPPEMKSVQDGNDKSLPWEGTLC